LIALADPVRPSVPRALVEALHGRDQLLCVLAASAGVLGSELAKRFPRGRWQR
jgi:hypothetical protein